MDFTGIINEFGLSFRPSILEARTRFLHSLKNGQKVKESIVRARKPKTNEQVATVFGLVIMTICQELNDRGEEITKEVMGKRFSVRPTKDNVKQFLYDLFAPKDENGKLKTLSQMDISEVRDFIDACLVNMAQEPFFIYIPDPDTNWRIK